MCWRWIRSDLIPDQPIASDSPRCQPAVHEMDGGSNEQWVDVAAHGSVGGYEELQRCKQLSGQLLLMACSRFNLPPRALPARRRRREVGVT
jgi:hypothetical protein